MYSLFKFEIKKIYYNSFSLLFCWGIPILALVLVGVLCKNELAPKSNLLMINYVFPSYIILSVLVISGTMLPLIFGNDRIEKRIKQLSVAGIQPSNYLIILIFFNYLIFLISFLLMLLIGTIALNLKITIGFGFWILFLASLMYFCNSFIFLTIANKAKKFRTLMGWIFLVFYVFIFLSGATIPLFMFPEWWTYINFILPAGLPIILLNAIQTNTLSEYWYCFIILIFYLCLSIFGMIKTFTWD